MIREQKLEMVLLNLGRLFGYMTVHIGQRRQGTNMRHCIVRRTG